MLASHEQVVNPATDFLHFPGLRLSIYSITKFIGPIWAQNNLKARVYSGNIYL